MPPHSPHLDTYQNHPQTRDHTTPYKAAHTCPYRKAPLPTPAAQAMLTHSGITEAAARWFITAIYLPAAPVVMLILALPTARPLPTRLLLLSTTNWLTIRIIPLALLPTLFSAVNRVGNGQRTITIVTLCQGRILPAHVPHPFRPRPPNRESRKPSPGGSPSPSSPCLPCC